MSRMLLSVIAFVLVACLMQVHAGSQAGDWQLSLGGGWQYDNWSVNGSNSKVHFSGKPENVSAMLKYGYFVTDNFELALAPQYIYTHKSDVDGHGNDLTQRAYAATIEPDWNFNPHGRIVPYIGPHAGGGVVHSESSSAAGDDDGTMWMVGGHAGIKWFLTQALALDTSLRYTYSETRVYGDRTKDRAIGLFAGLLFVF